MIRRATSSKLMLNYFSDIELNMQFDQTGFLIEHAQFDRTANSCNKETRKKNPSENFKKQQNLIHKYGYGKTIGQCDCLLNFQIYYLSPPLKCFAYRRDFFPGLKKCLFSVSAYSLRSLKSFLILEFI